MGLDMFLEKETYVGAQYDFRNVKGTLKIEVGEDKRVLPVKFERLSVVREAVAYWRKANAIHQWFVDNCQDGVDECQEARVYPEQLQELLDTCKEIQKDHSLANELLPTQNGFFFGSTEYDDWYFQDIDFTVKVLEEILAEPNAHDVHYIYQSSW